MQIPLLHPTLSILLLPVLVWQGYKVRKIIPRLAEAEGAREGLVREGMQTRPIRILIIGDSAAAGVGVEAQEEALAGQLISHLSNHSVEWRLIAKSGYKLRDVKKMLEQHNEAYDIAVVSAGINDATSRTRRHQFLCDLKALSDHLKYRNGVKRILYTAVPPMQVFPALPQPLRWYLGQRAKRLNSVLHAHCQNYEVAHMMVMDFPFTADYMASDGFHPGAEGYRFWGGRAAAVIKEWIAKNPLN